MELQLVTVEDAMECTECIRLAVFIGELSSNPLLDTRVSLTSKPGLDKVSLAMISAQTYI